MDDLSSSSPSSLEGGLVQFFQLLDASDTMPIDLRILNDEDPWIVSDSCHVTQLDGIENAQELACTYPEPPPTIQEITDSYHQNPAEECAKMQDEVSCMSSKGDHQPLHHINSKA